MNRVRAFVVGVSRYFTESWRLDGASRNAALVAAWLSRNGVPDDRIHLFCDRDALDGETLTWLDGTSVAVGRTDYATLNQFWRVALPAFAQPGDRLFVFWSGHGITDPNENRLFFCGDYTTQLMTSVFDASAFATALRGPDYRSYGERLVFADVCGNYGDAVVAPAQSRVSGLARVDQTVVFASVDGDFAEVDQRAGAFTEALLQTLNHFQSTWPEQDLFLARFRDTLEATRVYPFLVSWKSNSEQSIDRRFGRAPVDHAQIVYAMLQRHDISAIQRTHFERTRTTLGLGGDHGGDTLRQMVELLADMQDAGDGGAPYGLVEFLERLSADPSLAEQARRDIGTWIGEHGVEHRTEVQELLAAERRHRSLLIEVSHVGGQLSEVRTYVRYSNLMPDPAASGTTSEVVSWDELVSAVRRCVEAPQMEPVSGDLIIHFLIDLPQFELPFHQIPLSDGKPLGEHYICVVHYQTRARMADDKSEVQRWKRWAEIVRDTAVGALPLNRVDTSELLPVDGLCHVGFPLAPGAVDGAQRERLRKLLRLGAPLICLASRQPDDGLGPTPEPRRDDCQVGRDRTASRASRWQNPRMCDRITGDAAVGRATVPAVHDGRRSLLMTEWRIFQGDGTRHDRLTELPPPPPWRFGQRRAEIAPAPSVPNRTEEPRAIPFRPTQDMIRAVNAAIYLRRPLLLTGKPGTGKSTLISKVADELQIGPVLRWPINSRSTVRGGVYDYDAVGRLQAVSGDAAAVEDYLVLGPLGAALAAVVARLRCWLTKLTNLTSISPTIS